MIELAPHNKRGLGLTNPVLNAAGVLGFARESRGVVEIAILGAFVTNPLTATPRAAAHPPNAVPLANGVLIHTGLPNPGVSLALRRYAREWQRLGPPVIVHLAATSPDEVRHSMAKIERVEGVSGVELGLREDTSAGELVQMVRAARGTLPLIVRLPLERAVELCQAAAGAGADALTVGAPPRGTVQVGERTVTGRVYSPDSYAMALQSVRQVTAAMRERDVPIVGAGGLFSLEAVRTMLAAGAAAVQVDGILWREPEILAQLALVTG
jgi:dihydroorotate dehydrogenase (NAD+) catalytic subunit